MPPFDDGEIVGIVPGGVGEQLLCADVCAAKITDEVEALQRKQSRAGRGDAELLRDITQSFVRPTVVPRDIVHAGAGFVHQRRAEGMGPIRDSV